MAYTIDGLFISQKGTRWERYSFKKEDMRVNKDISRILQNALNTGTFELSVKKWHKIG